MAEKYINLLSPTPEHQMLRDTIRSFAQTEVRPQAEHHDKLEQFNLNLFRKLGELGVLGLSVPEEFGGAGMDALASVIVHEELSAEDPGFCLAYLAHSLLMVNNLAVNGSPEQKAKYLPKLCSGEWVGCMAMSEPDYGTDVMGMQTVAVKNSGGQYTINGRKMWITNGCIDDAKTPADLVWLYAKSGEDSKGRPSLSTFIIEKGAPGYAVGQKILGKLGMRASNTAELVFEDCTVGPAQMVGAEGSSLHHMMRNLEIERVGLAAMSLGIAKRSIEIMVKYANERRAFGQELKNFGQIQRFISESYAEYKACKSYVYMTAAGIDINESSGRLDSDGVKLVTTTMAKTVADRAIQVLGGYGYVSEYVVERLWRDSKLLEIGGGTLEAHQRNITKDLSKQLSQESLAL